MIAVKRFVALDAAAVSEDDLVSQEGYEREVAFPVSSFFIPLPLLERTEAGADKAMKSTGGAESARCAKATRLIFFIPFGARRVWQTAGKTALDGRDDAACGK
jgi:hypothetical protein